MSRNRKNAIGKLLIFDLGNTLVRYRGVSLNWSEHYEKALSEALSQQGIGYTDKRMDSAKDIPMFYNTRINFRTFEIEEGETLEMLRAMGHKTAVLTDVPYGMPKTFVMDDLGELSGSIDYVLTSCEVGHR
ncbi:MAG: hypothetical protein JXA95_07875 [Spirochaetales bacterium]|nr:hypothetical protein [Spirochaetales bacterium]